MPNRLARETSPYLLQHANNPVDWYPWGAEALARAKAEDKPILLSIGYAACHWCHVMEHESFENAAIAKRMNDGFVNIKVDREERPDLDQIYQQVVQLMGRSGGWPLTVFLTPEQRPFFAGTYFPPSDKMGMPGFPTVLESVADAFATKRGDVELQAREIATAIASDERTSPRAARETTEPSGSGSDLLRQASRRLLARFDHRHGGFGGRPKFPNTMALDVLLRRGVLEGDRVCVESVDGALGAMRRGGIWDQLRGGFHRYSTDERWLVPHFEKMLYDNALLLRLYVDGWRALQNPLYARTAREIVGYLLTEMRDPATGGFYASQDADSEGYEGKFFVFTLEQTRAAIGDDPLAFAVACQVFGIDEAGNFEDSGATVLSEHRPVERAAAILDAPLAEVEAALGRAKNALLAARKKRVAPPTDDKVLASWNGLLIGALADAGRALGEPSFVDAAKAAFGAIETHLLKNGRVARYLRNGRAASTAPGFLDDQAYVAAAAIDLYEATGEVGYLATARAIASEMVRHHADPAGGFFLTPDDGEQLIARTKDTFDQAVPAPASVAADVCLRLAAIADPSLEEPAQRQIEAFAELAPTQPFGRAQAVLVLDRASRGSVDVVLVGPRDDPRVLALRDACCRAYLPNRNLVWLDPNDPATSAAAPVLAEGKPAPKDGGVAAYVCRNRTCSAPVATADELAALLRA